jgi:hypothetical protein
MNLFSIIEEIEKVDPELGDRLSPRRDAIKNITSFGSKVAVAALPFAISTLFKKAYGQQSTSTVVGILNYALTLEHLEAAFYNAGVAAAGSTLTIPSSDLPYIKQIQSDENNHVNFLTTVINSLGGSPVTASNYDFTAKGTFPTVFSSYTTFLSVAIAFEDTGVRAYKGQAPNLIGNQTILTAALGIHAVEARHASANRYLLHNQGVAIKSWISGSQSVSNDTGIAAVNGNYAGENNTMQGGVDVSTLPGANGAALPYTAAIECFDEPLDMPTVVGLVTPFFA